MPIRNSIGGDSAGNYGYPRVRAATENNWHRTFTDNNTSTQWANGAVSYNKSLDLAIDKNENSFVVGYLTPYAGTSTVSAGQPSIGFLTKYTSNGEYCWSKKFSGFGSELANQSWIGGVAVGPLTGNVYVLGMMQTQGNQEPILASFDTNGNLLWQKTLSAYVKVFPHGIDVDSKERVWVTGQTINNQNYAIVYVINGITGNTITGGSSPYLNYVGGGGTYVWTEGYAIKCGPNDTAAIIGACYGPTSGQSDQVVFAIINVSGNFLYGAKWNTQAGEAPFFLSSQTQNAAGNLVTIQNLEGRIRSIFYDDVDNTWNVLNNGYISAGTATPSSNSYLWRFNTSGNTGPNWIIYAPTSQGTQSYICGCVDYNYTSYGGGSGRTYLLGGQQAGTNTYWSPVLYQIGLGYSANPAWGRLVNTNPTSVPDNNYIYPSISAIKSPSYAIQATAGNGPIGADSYPSMKNYAAINIRNDASLVTTGKSPVSYYGVSAGVMKNEKWFYNTMSGSNYYYGFTNPNQFDPVNSSPPATLTNGAGYRTQYGSNTVSTVSFPANYQAANTGNMLSWGAGYVNNTASSFTISNAQTGGGSYGFTYYGYGDWLNG